MTYEINETHDPNLKSWIESANAPDTDFPIQNLPFCMFRKKDSDERPRLGFAIGDFVFDYELCREKEVLRPDENSEIEKSLGRLTYDFHLTSGVDGVASEAFSSLRRRLIEALRSDAEMYAGCVSGAITKTEYLGLIEKNGFTNITIQKEKKINLPDDILSNYLSPAAIKDYHHSGAGVYSITVYAEKAKDSCCKPGAGCC